MIGCSLRPLKPDGVLFFEKSSMYLHVGSLLTKTACYTVVGCLFGQTIATGALLGLISFVVTRALNFLGEKADWRGLDKNGRGFEISTKLLLAVDLAMEMSGTGLACFLAAELVGFVADRILFFKRREEPIEFMGVDGFPIRPDIMNQY